MSEYTLTPDEVESLDALAAEHQAAFEAERSILLRSIIRHRKLKPGSWKLTDGKLAKEE